MQKLMALLAAAGLVTTLGSVQADELQGQLEQARKDACDKQRAELQAEKEGSGKGSAGLAASLLGSVKKEVSKHLDDACGNPDDASEG
ncbi:hypothetical protein [Metapseudomonas otitidis]|uniref:Uncharacterized protein n=1 Tax=Metapseudomonas otitidis TaxID=319939 RepID=A0ABU3XQN5_9GAMM|nr:hypothetical protein [Pseudomonas otitidis]MDH0339231.1 hypothetical protein [Pseudomonas otitidis]MDV3440220.1 hypothetical protein [Pseudomonas otitidis]MEE1891814.1 hypothetical protein [Pseudomonas otitidis]WMR34624.1 hypothetical protein QT513_07740 [Pseudomonas otitidis]